MILNFKNSRVINCKENSGNARKPKKVYSVIILYKLWNIGEGKLFTLVSFLLFFYRRNGASRLKIVIITIAPKMSSKIP